MTRTWSYSQLQVAQSCLHRWKRVYIDGEREPPTGASVLGSLCHAAMARLVRMAQGDAAPPADGELEAVCRQAMTQLSPAERALVTDATVAEAVELLRRAWTAIPLGEVVVEEEIEAPLSLRLLREAVSQAGGTPPDEPDRIRGVIDVARLLGDEVEAVDWKFGHLRYEPDAEHWQLGLYLLLLLHRYGARKASGALVYPRYEEDGQPAVARLTVDEDRLEPALAAGRTAIAIAAKVRVAVERGDFPATPGSYCAYCAFATECPAFRDLVRRVDARTPYERRISSEEEARATARDLLVAEAAVEGLRRALDVWTEAHGPFQEGGHWFARFPRAEYDWDVPGVIRALEQAGDRVFDEDGMPAPGGVLTLDRAKLRQRLGTRKWGPVLRPHVRIRSEVRFGHRAQPPQGGGGEDDAAAGA